MLSISTFCFANGVGIINASTGVYTKMTASTVAVTVENQVAVVTALQTFRNTLTTEQTVKYAFPLPEGASALKLRWYINGVWTTASFSASPQDTSLPGGGTIIASLKTYLGNTPLYFSIPEKLKKDSLLRVELVYVQLLPYKNGNVDFLYPNNYQMIQTAAADSQIFSFTVSSQRTIDSIRSLNHTDMTLMHSAAVSSASWKRIEGAVDKDYRIRYSLRLTELGLFSMSTNLPDSLGYFAFIAEPNPTSGADVLRKVFTLIIDRSGSMGGTKMEQARNTAAFIVQNLNEGDKFNLIDFDDIITSFRPGHVLYTSAARDSALLFVNALNARGLTNISGAFEKAVPQFAVSADSATANIIIFLTDGHPTAGVTDPQALINKVKQLVTALERKVAVFVFGIGSDVNTQLLASLASQNNGLAEFLGNDELQQRITDFYLRIRNPVLVNTTLQLASSNIREVYPNPLPNLYKGEQMLVTGIYSPTAPVELKLEGTAFGKPVSYTYTLTLSDTAVPANQFLPKIWAKKKIEHLLVKYYTAPTGSLQADSVKKQITALSLSYGVISPFTSFSNPGSTSSVERPDRPGTNAVAAGFTLEGNYPNPFNPSTTIRFTVHDQSSGTAFVRIYNSIGQLVAELSVMVNGPGSYAVDWNAVDQMGMLLPTGAYIAVVEFGDRLLAHKMMLMK